VARTGRPPGTTGIKQRLSDAAIEQRRAAAKKPRRRRKLSAPERKGLDEAVRIGRALNPQLMRLAQRKANLEEKFLNLLEREMKSGNVDLDRVEQLMRVTMRAGEFGTFSGQVWDRFGQPRKLKAEVDLHAAPRIFLDFPEMDAAWEAAEDAHARSPGGGAGHANGATRG
jgi:hypothetical protein